MARFSLHQFTKKKIRSFVQPSDYAIQTSPLKLSGEALREAAIWN